MKKNNTEWSKSRLFFELWWRTVVAMNIASIISVILLGYVIKMSEYDGFGQFLSILLDHFIDSGTFYETIWQAAVLSFLACLIRY